MKYKEVISAAAGTAGAIIVKLTGGWNGALRHPARPTASSEARTIANVLFMAILPCFDFCATEHLQPRVILPFRRTERKGGYGGVAGMFVLRMTTNRCRLAEWLMPPKGSGNALA